MGINSVLTRIRDSGYALLEKGRLIGRTHTERSLMRNRTRSDILTTEQQRAAKRFWSQYIKRPHLLAHQ